MKNLPILTLLLFAQQVSSQCFTTIDAGSYFNIGLKSDNTLWAWGYNYSGELGGGDIAETAVPIQIGTDNHWAQISVGSSHTIALKNDGTLWAWGINHSGQLGDGTVAGKNTPIQIGSDNDWRFVSTSANTSFAIKNNGTLWGWGQNNISHIGLGFTSLYEGVPMQVGNDNDWETVVAGHHHSMALKNDNTLWMWGSNLYGQLGNGTTLGTILVPSQVGTDNDWAQASIGLDHSMALKIDGTIWAWGGNTYGQLGDGTTQNKSTPTQIGSDAQWRFISADYSNTFAIKNDDSLWAWGSNINSEFGNGTTTSSNVPVQLGTNTDWKMISSGGGYYKTAMKQSNSIHYWGVNPLSSNIIFPNTSVPVQLVGGCTLAIGDFIASPLEIYPNPAQNLVNIVNNSNESVTTIKIFDITGKLSYNGAATSEVDITPLQAGIYILQLTSASTVRNFKLIKK